MDGVTSTANVRGVSLLGAPNEAAIRTTTGMLGNAAKASLGGKSGEDVRDAATLGGGMGLLSTVIRTSVNAAAGN